MKNNIAVNKTIGRLRPSTPNIYEIFKEGIHSYLSINCIEPFDGSNFLHNTMATINCKPVTAADVYLTKFSLSLGKNATTIAPKIGIHINKLRIFSMCISLVFY